MRFFPAEPDIATIFGRIMAEDIDLQPDFQRGEVWTQSKQQRLVDTILRGWVIPPILLIKSETSALQQVLDGQQRLAAIRDFKLNKFPVDGRIQPLSAHVKAMHGRFYADLPPDVAKLFDRTTLRIYEIADFEPEEPAEIFFRLNQPTTLTSAEKRNAYLGPVRSQIRELADSIDKANDIQQIVGFTNSRMAYDDVLARVACALEFGTLRRKITASAVQEMYRRKAPLAEGVESRLEMALNLFLNASMAELHTTGFVAKHNKATMFSWILFFARLDRNANADEAFRFYRSFEFTRNRDAKLLLSDVLDGVKPALRMRASPLLHVFSDRATSRVGDVSSILLRDIILWIIWDRFTSGLEGGCTDPSYSMLTTSKVELDSLYRGRIEGDTEEVLLLEFADSINWGVELFK
jgi:hypothetical protein